MRAAVHQNPTPANLKRVKVLSLPAGMPAGDPLARV